MKKFEKVFVAGTFDFLHIGHQYLLWKAVSFAESMVVIVARDENVLRIKGKKPYFSEQKRLERISQEFLPDTIVKLGGNSSDFLQTLINEKPDAIFLGYDQQLPFYNKNLAGFGIEIVKVPAFYPEFFKSSYFREIENRNNLRK